MSLVGCFIDQMCCRAVGSVIRSLAGCCLQLASQWALTNGDTPSVVCVFQFPMCIEVLNYFWGWHCASEVCHISAPRWGLDGKGPLYSRVEWSFLPSDVPRITTAYTENQPSVYAVVIRRSQFGQDLDVFTHCACALEDESAFCS